MWDMKSEDEEEEEEALKEEKYKAKCGFSNVYV